jgi:signal peptidase I
MPRKRRVSRVAIVLILSAIICLSLSSWFLTKERVLVESSSMMHGDAPDRGILDTGDLAQVIEYSSEDDIVTYFEGKERDYKTAGDYGDVIIYWRNGDESTTPIIHRVILWLEFDQEATDADPDNKSYFNIPELGLYNLTGQFVIAEYFKTYYPDEPNGPLIIDFDKIYQNMGSNPHSGYLTKGDYNPLTGIDQYTNSEPVKFEWIEGRAQVIDSTIAYLVGLVESSPSDCGPAQLYQPGSRRRPLDRDETGDDQGSRAAGSTGRLKKTGKWKEPEDEDEKSESVAMSDTPQQN